MILDNEAIVSAMNVLSAEAIARRDAGIINTRFGLQHHASLMHDKLGRWMTEADEARRASEILGLAVDALVALALTMPKIDVDLDALVARENRKMIEELTANE